MLDVPSVSTEIDEEMKWGIKYFLCIWTRAVSGQPEVKWLETGETATVNERTNFVHESIELRVSWAAHRACLLYTSRCV